jgi:hypothetical protein
MMIYNPKKLVLDGFGAYFQTHQYHGIIIVGMPAGV